MGGLSVNFAEIEGSFEPLPEGEYECVVERVEVRDSNSSDHDYLNWELKVLDEEYEDRRLWMITSLSPKALFRLKDVFVALGVIDGDEELEIEWEDDVDITSKEGPLVTNPELEDLPCVAVVTNEVYDGRERNRVQELVGGASDGPARARDDDDEDDEPEEEAPPKPKRKAAAKKPAAKKPARRKQAAKKPAARGRQRKLR
jgi:hypothetical protein